jgi:hypothetical protein
MVNVHSKMIKVEDSQDLNMQVRGRLPQQQHARLACGYA